MKWARRSDELEAFKTQINLCAYMASRGFTLDRKKSSRSSAVMRHADGDKLIVARGANRHWKYFNVHDARDKGTIIDFVQVRDRTSLGEIRKELRPWIGVPGTTIVAYQEQMTELVPSQHDAARVTAAWEKALPINGMHDYLQRERQIPHRVLCDPIFAECIRTDHRRNALFGHHNSVGLCGIEIKNRGFTGFSPGGTKGLFLSQSRAEDHELIVCETAIDALSFAALFGTLGRRFASTAGQVSPAQIKLLQSTVAQLPAESTVVLAMDNDAAGVRLAESITAALQQADLPDIRYTIRLPREAGADWNDILRNSGLPRLPFPSCE